MIDHHVDYKGISQGKWAVGYNENGIILVLESWLGTDDRLILSPDDIDELIEELNNKKEKFLHD